MNIPSTNGISGSPQSAASFQRAAKKEEPTQLPAANVGNADGVTQPTDGDGSHVSKRLRAYAAKVETRLSNALASRDLSPRQREVIEMKSKEFQALMKRLENAYLPGSGSSMSDMHKVLGHIMTTLDDTLGGLKSAGPQHSPSTTGISPTGSSGGLDTIA
jgi:hypothetical protein